MLGMPEVTGVGNPPMGLEMPSHGTSWDVWKSCPAPEPLVSTWGLSTAASCPDFPLFHDNS